MYQRDKKYTLKRSGGSCDTKKYSNPFFKKKNKSKFKINLDFSPNIKIVAIIFFLIVFSFFWALFFSDYFDIKKIEINGGGKISVDEIRKYANNQTTTKRFIFFSQKNIFLFNKKQFLFFLHSRHSFEYVNIDKDYPDRLTIDFNEKPYEITWLEDDKYYYTDREGGIIAEANLLELKEKKYPLIHNLSDSKINESNITVNIENLDFIILLFSKIKEYSNDFEVDKFIIDNDVESVKMSILDGPEIYFNVNLDIEKQVNKLLAVKREKLKQNFNDIEYINLKIGDSVYYR